MGFVHGLLQIGRAMVFRQGMGPFLEVVPSLKLLIKCYAGAVEVGKGSASFAVNAASARACSDKLNTFDPAVTHDSGGEHEPIDPDSFFHAVKPAAKTKTLLPTIGR